MGDCPTPREHQDWWPAMRRALRKPRLLLICIVLSMAALAAVVVIDRHGRIVAPLQFRFVEPFSHGLARVKLGEKWGFIDKSGKMVLEPRFRYASDFVNGFIRVELDGKCGFVNEAGKLAIEPRFADAHNFSHGLAPACVLREVKRP